MRFILPSKSLFKVAVFGSEALYLIVDFLVQRAQAIVKEKWIGTRSVLGLFSVTVCRDRTNVRGLVHDHLSVAKSNRRAS